MNIVVTGSNGFIGRHLCRALAEAGHAVTGLDIRTGHDVLSCELSDADLVYHLAAQTDAGCEDALADARVNIMGLLRVLQRYGDKVVFASSSMVQHPQTPYAISKLAGEHYCKLYGASVIRLCNVYGPGGHSVIDVFEKAQTLTIHGDGQQVRSFASVGAAVLLLLQELGGRQPMRLLRGTPRSVLDVAACHPGKPRVHAPARAFDPVSVTQ